MISMKSKCICCGVVDMKKQQGNDDEPKSAASLAVRHAHIFLH